MCVCAYTRNYSKRLTDGVYFIQTSKHHLTTNITKLSWLKKILIVQKECGLASLFVWLHTHWTRASEAIMNKNFHCMFKGIYTRKSPKKTPCFVFFIVMHFQNYFMELNDIWCIQVFTYNCQRNFTLVRNQFRLTSTSNKVETKLNKFLLVYAILLTKKVSYGNKI